MSSFHLEEEVFRLLKRFDKTLAIAESCTAGALSGRLAVANPGISMYLKGGVIAYTVETKKRLLSITPSQIQKHHVVSEFVAREMAQSVKDLLQADLGFGITGSAGPGVEPGSRVGDFCLALAISNLTIYSATFYFGNLSREAFMNLAISRSLEFILQYIH